MQEKEVMIQSKNAFRQWKDLWINNCQINKDLASASIKVLQNQGIGKRVVCCAMGPSLEKDIKTLKEYRDVIDIICVDKAYKYLVQNGIYPDFMMISDAQVSYELYCEPVQVHTDKTVLIGNINSNPKWGQAWRGHKFYYINQDNIKSEVIFSKLTGCNDFLIAGSNVSNALLIFATTLMNYDRYYLSGYDFSWPSGESFYAFDKNHAKKKYLNQMRTYDRDYNLVNTSQNLWFSKRWLEGFIYKVVGAEKVYNCSDGILKIPFMSRLDDELSKINCYHRKLNPKEILLKAEKTFIVNSESDFEIAKKIMSDKGNKVTSMVIKFLSNGDDELVGERKTREVGVQK